MILVINKHLVPSKTKAWALWPFVILKDEKYNTPITIRHEKIHLKQQAEMLVLPFYIAYILNFLINIVLMKKTPYRNIVFEKEAYSNQMDINYLNNRPFWAWLKYF